MLIMPRVQDPLRSTKSRTLCCPGGGIGRRDGLKIRWPQRLCGFESHPGYRTVYYKALILNGLALCCFDDVNTISTKYARIAEAGG